LIDDFEVYKFFELQEKSHFDPRHQDQKKIYRVVDNKIEDRDSFPDGNKNHNLKHQIGECLRKIDLPPRGSFYADQSPSN